MELEWVEGAEISVRAEDGTVVLSANREGLLSLAGHFAALAEEAPGSHLHLDESNALEDGSAAKGVVLDWQGKTVHTYRNAVDFDFWGDYMYILTKEALYRVPESGRQDEGICAVFRKWIEKEGFSCKMGSARPACTTSSRRKSAAAS